MLTEREIDQAYTDHVKDTGGCRQDYFAVVYLQREFGISREQAVNQVSFGGNDYGFDAFHISPEKRNAYLFQFKMTHSHSQFKGSFQRLIDSGMARVFGAESQDGKQNDLVAQLKNALFENQAVIDRVYIHFVFLGDPQKADQSQVLDKLREDLENKKHLVDSYFQRPVTLVIEFKSATSRKVGGTSRHSTTRAYDIEMSKFIEQKGPNGELMYLNFISLPELHSMYMEMGRKFLDRNIRDALPEEGSINTSIQRTLRNMLLEKSEPPTTLAFIHNGVTISAESVSIQDGVAKITEPRLLNGAQTVSNFHRFLEKNRDNPKFNSMKAAAKEAKVMCKIITEAKPEFVTTVTINNNRQTPVKPWNLRANDMIQLDLQDKFVSELGIYYERQENAFNNLSDEELEEQGITAQKQVQLPMLAKTFLVTDGQIDKLSNLKDVFENEKIYSAVFSQQRLRADARKIILCYKVQYRLKRLIDEILDKGQRKYEYVGKARNLLWALLCQGILNDEDIEKKAEQFGTSLCVEADFTAWLAKIASTRCRFLISAVVSDRAYAEKVAEGNYAFLRTNSAYDKCMDEAYKKFRWTARKLK